MITHRADIRRPLCHSQAPRHMLFSTALRSSFTSLISRLDSEGILSTNDAPNPPSLPLHKILKEGMEMQCLGFVVEKFTSNKPSPRPDCRCFIWIGEKIAYPIDQTVYRPWFYNHRVTTVFQKPADIGNVRYNNGLTRRQVLTKFKREACVSIAHIRPRDAWNVGLTQSAIIFIVVTVSAILDRFL